MQQRHNIAARAGRWSAQHRKKAIFGWLAFVIASLAIGGALGVNTLSDEDSGVGESGRADKTLHEAFPQKTKESVLVQSAKLKATDAAFRAGVDDTVRRLEAAKDVRDVAGPYPADGQISEDGHSALIDFEIAGDPETATDRIDPALAATAAAAKANPELRIEQFGDASADKAISKTFEDDFKKAELTSLPITLIILVLAFGAIVAAGVPLLLALSGVAATIGLLAPISLIAPVDESVNSVILLIGLAVGVDYSLFYLRREREERAAGRSEQASLEAAAATSGRAVLISGFTVMIAMAGMYLAGAATFQSFATGTILVVAVSVIGSLTVLPAVLSKLGDRVDKGRVPLIGRIKARTAQAGIWSRIVDRVLRRPLLSALVSGGLLVAVALPTLAMQTSVPGVDGLPQDLPVVQTYNRIQEAFPGESIPANVVVEADDVTTGATAAAIDTLQADAAMQSDLFEPGATVEVSPDKTVANVAIPIAGNGTDATSNEALDELRGELIPATVGTVAGATTDVTGMTAETADFNASMSSHIPWVFAFVLTAAFLLLMVTFRSVMIPIKAILLNLLSVGAAYGLLVLVFQEGWGESLLGFESTGAITAWLPLFLFVVLFGLSMDYHVFILTRIKELVDRGMRTDRAVAEGIKSTAGVVTSAAVVMVAVFSIFATLSSLEFKQMGVGLAAAILIDATIVRGVLLPATMKLLGEWNWWLPSWLEWLPRVSQEPSVDASRPVFDGAAQPELEPEPAGVA
ncbi:MAG TPA: MMPL family transporter [Thermoleophilaceae bacterium]|nr:MMPL family transporter [Thermoleophilaceae bacterium]